MERFGLLKKSWKVFEDVCQNNSAEEHSHWSRLPSGFRGGLKCEKLKYKG